MAKRPKRPGTPKGMGGMMQQIQQLQEQLLAAQEALKTETVSATTGGGAVKAVVTGDQRLQALELAPEMVAEMDVEMLQDLIVLAVNSALDQSRELATERLGPLTSGLPF